MKKEHLTLSEEQEATLQDLLKKGTLKARNEKRAQALLELNKGKTYSAVADIVNVKYTTVSSWAKKYEQEGLKMLKDKPRSGRPHKYTASQKAKITELARSKPPSGRTSWTLRLLANKVVERGIVEEISFKQVGNILEETLPKGIPKDTDASKS